MLPGLRPTCTTTAMHEHGPFLGLLPRPSVVTRVVSPKGTEKNISFMRPQDSSRWPFISRSDICSAPGSLHEHSPLLGQLSQQAPLPSLLTIFAPPVILMHVYARFVTEGLWFVGCSAPGRLHGPWAPIGLPDRLSPCPSISPQFQLRATQLPVRRLRINFRLHSGNFKFIYIHIHLLGCVGWYDQLQVHGVDALKLNLRIMLLALTVWSGTVAVSFV